MALTFGTRKADAPPAPSTGFIKYFRDGATRLVFLDEMDDWFEYYEHYSQEKSRSYPCTRDRDNCPGCTSPNEKERSASRRFLTNVLSPDSGYVDLWKIPTSLEGPLSRYSDKDGGTVRARIYEVFRGKNAQGKIEYSVDREEKFDLASVDYKSRMKSFEDALLDAYREAWDEDPDDDESPIQKASAPKAQPKVKKAKEEVEDKPPFEEEEEHDEDMELTEDQLNTMTTAQLKMLFRQAGLDAPDTDDAATLREALIEELGE